MDGSKTVEHVRIIGGSFFFCGRHELAPDIADENETGGEAAVGRGGNEDDEE